MHSFMIERRNKTIFNKLIIFYNKMDNIYLYIILAFIVSLILISVPTSYLVILEDNENSLIQNVINWSLLLFGLILGFTIANLYNRSVAINDTLVSDLSQLKIIYKILNRSEKADKPLASIRHYMQTVVEKDIPYLMKYEKECPDCILEFSNMNKDIYDYVLEGNSNFGDTILANMTTSFKLDNLLDEIDKNNYYIFIIIVMYIFIIVAMMFVTIKSKFIHFTVMFTLNLIILLSIYLMICLNDPFDPILGVDFTAYNDFYEEIRYADPTY